MGINHIVIDRLPKLPANKEYASLKKKVRVKKIVCREKLTFNGSALVKMVIKGI